MGPKCSTETHRARCRDKRLQRRDDKYKQREGQRSKLNQCMLCENCEYECEVRYRAIEHSKRGWLQGGETLCIGTIGSYDRAWARGWIQASDSYAVLAKMDLQPKSTLLWCSPIYVISKA